MTVSLPSHSTGPKWPWHLSSLALLIILPSTSRGPYMPNPSSAYPNRGEWPVVPWLGKLKGWEGGEIKTASFSPGRALSHPPTSSLPPTFYALTISMNTHRADVVGLHKDAPSSYP